MFASAHSDDWSSQPFVISSAPPAALCVLASRWAPPSDASQPATRWAWLPAGYSHAGVACFVEPDLLFELTAFAAAADHPAAAELADFPLWSPPSVTPARDVRTARLFEESPISIDDMFEAAASVDDSADADAMVFPSRAARLQAAKFLLKLHRHG